VNLRLPLNHRAILASRGRVRPRPHRCTAARGGGVVLGREETARLFERQFLMSAERDGRGVTASAGRSARGCFPGSSRTRARSSSGSTGCGFDGIGCKYELSSGPDRLAAPGRAGRDLRGNPHWSRSSRRRRRGSSAASASTPAAKRRRRGPSSATILLHPAGRTATTRLHPRVPQPRGRGARGRRVALTTRGSRVRDHGEQPRGGGRGQQGREPETDSRPRRVTGSGALGRVHPQDRQRYQKQKNVERSWQLGRVPGHLPSPISSLAFRASPAGVPDDERFAQAPVGRR